MRSRATFRSSSTVRPIASASSSGAAKARIRAYVDERTKPLKEESAAIERERASLSSESNLTVRAAKALQLETRTEKLAQRYQELGVELKRLEAREHAAVLEKVDRAVSSVAKQRGISISADRADPAGSSSSGRQDLTDEVIRVYETMTASKVR